MKLNVLVAAIALVGMSATAQAAPTAKVRTAAQKAEVRAMRQEMQQAKTEAATAAGPSAADVGDADSFGRYAKFIGLMNSGQVLLSEISTDCDPDPAFPLGPDDRCVVLNPQPAVTNFDFPDIGRMVIPGKSANSLFCHTQTPIASATLRNTTAATIPSARIVYTPYYTFENSVLADPTLINPVTGLPFNGKIETGLPGIRHQMSLQPNDSFIARDDETRFCIAGMISKRQLTETYGLTDAQAKKFFEKDTIVTMGISGQAQGVQFSGIINNVRWLGD